METLLFRKAAKVVDRLRNAGFEAYFVGGSVRDLLRGIEPREFDIVTSARPDQVRALFPRTYAVGESFGVIIVLEEGEKYEVATFRTEEGYADGRRPGRVELAASAEEDVRRRDFTVNGLLMDPKTGRILDFVGGREDIERKLIRTIGDPGERFSEDHLRMLRAVRFAANLGFEIEPGTMGSIRGKAPCILRISAERIREELTKILTGCDARRGMELLDSSGLLKLLLPEVDALHAVEQPPRFHPEGDAWEHTLKMLGILSRGQGGRADSRLAWAALLHDTGKALSLSEDEKGIHFYGHAAEGRIIAAGIMTRLRFSNSDRQTVDSLVRHHMEFINVTRMRPLKLRRFLSMPDFALHLELHRLDSLAGSGDLGTYEFCREKLAQMESEEPPPPPLLDGDDLIGAGFTPGPLFSRILAEVEDLQAEGELSSREEALEYALKKWGAERKAPGG